ncbi:porin family protein [Flavobacterium psychrotrophum]|uniref:porin family protein n=1 Tax=Flavobacterium psychrotrophum TaxID=2294119 RepID=UPI000E31BCBC|nr:porin family protein [Flavobacterium psychrotrophum]
MKKIFLAAAMLLGVMTTQAQGIDFGIKAGANFANFNGNDVDTEGITSWHAGAVLELNIVPTFSVQAEALYSSIGAKVKGGDDINLDYVSVPVLAKFYILPEKVSIVAGPQFSFLTKDTEDLKAKSTDIGLAGGLEAKIIAGLFVQARYVIGLTKVADGAYASDAKNGVFQLSVGYNIF